MTKICINCNNEFETNRTSRKFCSQSCAAQYNNRGKRRHGKARPLCIECGTEVSKNSKKFCSITCFNTYRYKEFINKWLKNQVSGYWKSINNGVSSHIRRWLMEQHRSKCQRCGWSEINHHTGKMPLQIHHKDGDSTNCRPENLELLCPNCHSLTETFGSLNNGSGRSRRYATIV